VGGGESMTKRQQELWKQRKTLADSGWNVQKRDSVHFNEGSETLNHAELKLVTCWYLKHELDYRVDTEVALDAGEVDVLAYNADDIIVVEIETNADRATITDKIKRYITDQPPRDMFVVDPTEAPSKLMDRYEFVKGEIGL
jgi:hypothetical protein